MNCLLISCLQLIQTPAFWEREIRWRRRRRKFSNPTNLHGNSISYFFIIVLLLILNEQTTYGLSKYDTAYACEGKILKIECQHGDVINLIRANYGRFSITICNDHGNAEWSVNCMSPTSLRVLSSKCTFRQNCSVPASTQIFGDPCIGTHKYLEAQYQCISESLTSTQTIRQQPEWLFTSQPSVWSTSTVRLASTTQHILTNHIYEKHSNSSLSHKTFDNKSSPIIPHTTETSLTEIMSTKKPLRSTTKIYNSTFYCSPRHQRNLFWNYTRVGDHFVQPCPGGATGLAIWKCILIFQKQELKSNWFPVAPDLTQCRSLWLNSLEIRVSQRDSPLLAVASDLSYKTETKLLLGGDMLLSTKIIQIISERIANEYRNGGITSSINALDFKLREQTVYDVLHCIVRTSSNLLDAQQQQAWIDLNNDDQMRVATSLLTGLEDNAFLLADAIIRERNVMQKVKNILLSVRVIETRNIKQNEIFPNSKNDEHWSISDDLIELPKISLIENSEKSLVRIVFIAFDRLELILRPTNRGDLLTSSTTTKTVQKLNISANQRLEYINFVNLNENRTIDLIQQQLQLDDQKIIKILNSKVISASLGKGRHIQLSQPIRLRLRHIKQERVSNPRCVFWNYIDHAWSEDGCFVESSNRTHTFCMCNHLTNFALLMDYQLHSSSTTMSMHNNTKLDNSYKKNVNEDFNTKNIHMFMYISIIGCTLLIIISLAAILMTSNEKWCYLSTIHRNLFCCLLIIEILFLIGLELTPTNYLCGFVGTFLHCAYLSASACILMQFYCLYQMLMKLDSASQAAAQNGNTCTGTETSLFVGHHLNRTWFYMITYGTTFTIVTIALCIDPAIYTERSKQQCLWMSQNSQLFYFTFLLPFVILFLAIIIFGILSIFIMCHRPIIVLGKTERDSCVSIIKFNLIYSIVLLFLFVGSLLFGYFYIQGMLKQHKFMSDSGNEFKRDIYGYIFILLNLVQGILLFIQHCVMNVKVRTEYERYMKKHQFFSSICCHRPPTSQQHSHHPTTCNQSPDNIPSRNCEDDDDVIAGDDLTMMANLQHQRHQRIPTNNSLHGSLYGFNKIEYQHPTPLQRQQQQPFLYNFGQFSASQTSENSINQITSQFYDTRSCGTRNCEYIRRIPIPSDDDLEDDEPIYEEIGQRIQEKLSSKQRQFSVMLNDNNTITSYINSAQQNDKRLQNTQQQRFY